MKKHLALLSFLILTLVSCGKNTYENNIKKQLLRLCFHTEPLTLDPRKCGDVISSTVQFMLFEGLTRMTPESTTQPALAESIEISDDLKTYTFYLRDDIHWSDGTPITSRDFERSWKNMLDPEFPSPSANLLYLIKNAERAKKGEVPLNDVGIEVVDEQTLVVKLEHSSAYFLELTSFCSLFPSPERALVSSGPFIIKSWKKGRSLTLEKNPRYWDNKNVELNGIHIDFIDDEMTALQLYEQGKVDFHGTMLSEIPLDAIPSLVAKKQIQSKPIASTTMCTFNTRSFPFNNVHIRKAFAYAIDREEIVKNVLGLGEITAKGVVAPILKENQPLPKYHETNIERAKSELALGMEELGISLSDLQNLTYTFANARKNQKVAEVIQQQLRKSLGILIQLESLDFRICVNKIRSRSFAMAQYGWVAQFNDQMNILARFEYKEGPSNETGWESREYQSLLKDSLVCLDSQERGIILQKAEDIFNEDVPLTSLYHSNYSYMEKPYVRNVYISPIGSIHFGNVYFAERQNGV